jgi:hypothetical protein
MSMMFGKGGGSLFSSGSGDGGFFSSGSGEDGFGDDTMKILSIPLAKQVLDAITIKLNSLSDE